MAKQNDKISRQKQRMRKEAYFWYERLTKLCFGPKFYRFGSHGFGVFIGLFRLARSVWTSSLAHSVRAKTKHCTQLYFEIGSSDYQKLLKNYQRTTNKEQQL